MFNTTGHKFMVNHTPHREKTKTELFLTCFPALGKGIYYAREQYAIFLLRRLGMSETDLPEPYYSDAVAHIQATTGSMNPVEPDLQPPRYENSP